MVEREREREMRELGVKSGTQSHLELIFLNHIKLERLFGPACTNYLRLRRTRQQNYVEGVH
jgi:hypothetical protein